MRITSLILILAVVAFGSGYQRTEPQTPIATATARAGSQETPSASTMTRALTQEQVVTAIEKLGGTVTREGNVPEGPVVVVNFGYKGSATLADVADYLERLHGLRILSLANSAVTDPDLERLKRLDQLTTLDLQFTKVTDAGLEHLKGLENLQKLYMQGTRVTDRGVKELQVALPHCTIKY